MKKENLGLGIMLMGVIIAQYQEFAAWMFAMILGIGGLIVIWAGAREE